MANDAISNNPSASSELAQAEEQAKIVAAKALEEGAKPTSSSSDTTPDPTKVVNPLEQELATTKKSYSELRSAFTQSTQDRSALQLQLTSLQEKQTEMMDAIANVSQGPYDPDKFMDELRAQGPKFLQAQLQGAIDKDRRASNKRIDTLESALYTSNVNQEVLRMSLDNETYPDFQKLYPEMLELSNNNNFPINTSATVRETVESLYNHVRSSHGQDAVKQAALQAQKDAESQAAIEAAATVTAGGKPSASGAPDPNKTNFEDYEKYVESVHGVAER